MTLLFENNTRISNRISDEDFETIVEDKSSMNNMKNVGIQATRSVYSKGFNNALKGFESTPEKEQQKWNIYLNMSDEEAERIRKYKKCRNTVFAILFLIIFLTLEFIYRLVLKADPNSDLRSTSPEVGMFLLSIFVGYSIAIFIAKILYGKQKKTDVPDTSYNYKFYDEYMVVKSENDGKVIRYNNIKAEEDFRYYYIISDNVTYKLDKNGFSVSSDDFKKLMNEKGIEIRPFVAGGYYQG